MSLLEACAEQLLQPAPPATLQSSPAVVWQQLSGGHVPGSSEQAVYMVRGPPRAARIALSRACAVLFRKGIGRHHAAPSGCKCLASWVLLLMGCAELQIWAGGHVSGSLNGSGTVSE